MRVGSRRRDIGIVLLAVFLVAAGAAVGIAAASGAIDPAQSNSENIGLSGTVSNPNQSNGENVALSGTVANPNQVNGETMGLAGTVANPDQGNTESIGLSGTVANPNQGNPETVGLSGTVSSPSSAVGEFVGLSGCVTDGSGTECSLDTPSVSTALSSPSVAAGSPAHDSASMSGGSSDAGGTVTYYYSSSPSCQTGATEVNAVTVANGAIPDSAPQSFSIPGTYYWYAAYTGDSKNAGANSPCEQLTVTKASPSLALALSSSAMAAGGSVHASASLSGATGSAGGSVTYQYFDGASCSGPPTAVGSPVAVSSGTVPDSQPQAFSVSGSYSWDAVYSGDTSNNSATSGCTQLTVSAAQPASGCSSVAGPVAETADALPNPALLLMLILPLLPRRRRGVSTMLAVIIVIAIAIAGGLLVYTVFFSSAGVASKNAQLVVNYGGIAVSSGGAVLTLQIQNAGSVPLTSIQAKVGGASLSVSSSLCLEPGQSAALTWSTAAGTLPGTYVIGTSYTVLVTAASPDGSTSAVVTASVAATG